VFPDYSKYTLAKTLHAAPEAENVTNNRAEYSALIAAIETGRRIDEDIGHKGTKLLFYTDSQLLINTATKWIQSWKNKGWRKADGERVLNLDLVVKIDELLKERRVEFKHVRAHTGGTDWMSTWNAKADELARAAAQGIEYFGMEK
jgi:ribonuclease HI